MIFCARHYDLVVVGRRPGQMAYRPISLRGSCSVAAGHC
jgi:hypothetical protein